jgi:Flagellar hook-length control protein FliK
MAMTDMLSGVLLARPVTRRLSSLPEAGQAPGRLEPGATVLARVGQALGEGEFVVFIGQQPLKLALPSTAKEGDTLHLMVLTTQPRPTFALVQDRLAATPSSSTSLSETGRFIGLLYGKDARSTTQSLPAAEAVVRSVPGTNRDLAPTLARSLARAVSESGLFYESHLAQWVRGERSLAQILREPQARIGADRGDALAAAVGPDAVSSGEPIAPAAPGGSGAASAGNEPLPVHPDAMALVRAQLDALEHAGFSWKGEIWPGQTMDWQVAEDGGGGAPTERRSWKTQLRLTLPNLGDVDVAIALDGDKLQLDIAASDRTSAAVLRGSGNNLNRALLASGLDLQGMRVVQRESGR